jgi:hypothetical protein
VKVISGNITIENMESALLYTFSTIAQSLGGAFALLAAFVLFRFQALAATMWESATVMRGILARFRGNFQRYDTLLVQAKYEVLIEEIELIIKRDQPPLSEAELAHLARLRELIQQHTRLKVTFRLAAFTTGAVMLFSVAAIPFAHIVYCVDVLSWLLLIMGVGGFIACLHLYWAVIKTAVYDG